MARPSEGSTTLIRDEASIEYLETLLADAEHLFEHSKGVAAVQALKLCRDLATEIDTAKRALIVTRDDLAELSEAELLEKLDGAARGMPPQHLEVFVRAWLDRQGWTLEVVRGHLQIVRPAREM